MARTGNRKIAIVFGCGGDRDKSKRSKMGKIANKFCDKIYLTDEYKTDKNKAQYAKNKLEYTLLRDIVHNCNIYYDPLHNEDTSIIDEDNGLLQMYRLFNDVAEVDEHSPWIIRFTFNRNIMMEHGIVMEDINMVILEWANKANDINKIKFIY